MTSRDNNERWQTIREQGLLRFVVVQGVLRWGFGTAVFWLLIMTAVTGGQIDYGRVVPTALVVFPVLGVVFGLSLWYVFTHRSSPTSG
ncbi:MAG: hypothetical protein AAF660_05295 [Pseudomonadota bacterium]